MVIVMYDNVRKAIVNIKVCLMGAYITNIILKITYIIQIKIVIGYRILKSINKISMYIPKILGKRENNSRFWRLSK